MNEETSPRIWIADPVKHQEIVRQAEEVLSANLPDDAIFIRNMPCEGRGDYYTPFTVKHVNGLFQTPPEHDLEAKLGVIHLIDSTLGEYPELYKKLRDGLTRQLLDGMESVGRLCLEMGDTETAEMVTRVHAELKAQYHARPDPSGDEHALEGMASTVNRLQGYKEQDDDWLARVISQRCMDAPGRN